jgi:hypothetical protein
MTFFDHRVVPWSPLLKQTPDFERIGDDLWEGGITVWVSVTVPGWWREVSTKQMVQSWRKLYSQNISKSKDPHICGGFTLSFEWFALRISHPTQHYCRDSRSRSYNDWSEEWAFAKDYNSLSRASDALKRRPIGIVRSWTLSNDECPSVRENCTESNQRQKNSLLFRKGCYPRLSMQFWFLSPSRQFLVKIPCRPRWAKHPVINEWPIAGCLRRHDGKRKVPFVGQRAEWEYILCGQLLSRLAQNWDRSNCARSLGLTDRPNTPGFRDCH